MGLILKKDADVEAFRNKLNQAKGKIEKFGLGGRVIDLALQGKDTKEIAGVLNVESKGTYTISQPTVLRWINHTGLFERRAKRGSSRKDTAKELRRVFMEYQKEVITVIDQVNKKYQAALIRTVKKISWKKGLSEVLKELEVRSDRRKSEGK